MLALAFCLAVAHAAPPAPIALSADQESELAQREVVVTQVAQPDGGTATVGVVDVAAPVDRAFAAVIDLEARIGEVGGLRAVSRYIDAPTQIGARWEMSVVGRAVVFHTLYDLDPADAYAKLSLDTSKDNDVQAIAGSYHAYAHGTGSRLVYTSVVDSGVYAPDWVKRWLADRSLVEALDGIRARAER